MNSPLLQVRACAVSSCVAILLSACGGGGGGGGGNPPPPPPVDTTAPDTTISAAPAALTNASSASFTFTSSEAGAIFESRVDGAAFAVVTSPQTVTNVAHGSHTFEVRARDAAGNTDASPASRTWVVDTVPPDTDFTATPANIALTEPHVFSAIAPGEANATFEMSVDNAAYNTVVFPTQLTALSNGAHNVRVRAFDAAGNADQTPAQFDWTVNVLPPDTTVTSQPPALTNNTSASFAFTATLAGSTFEYRLDGGAYIVATSPVQLSALDEGPHTFEVRSRFGNLVDATPASFTWRVDVTAPTAAIEFPTPLSYTDAATLTVRGTASDANSLASVRVNGVLASTATAFNTWRVAVPILPGNNTLTVSVADSAGNTTAAAATVSVANRGPMLLLPGGVDFDPASHRVIVTDVETHRVLGYNVSTGIGQLITDFTTSTTSSALGDVVVDSPNNRALVLDWGQDAIVAVDLLSGARSVLSQSTGSGPTSLSLGFGLAHDPAGNRLFVTVRGADAVIAVNLANGVRTVVSSPTVGTGTSFGNPLGIVYDAGAARLLVADAPFSTPAIYSVNIANGNRVVLSASPGTGTGPAMPGPTSLELDVNGNRLYVLDTSSSTLLGIDLATGNRTLFGGSATGSGSTLVAAPGLARNPANGNLFSAQRNGEILEISPLTLVRLRIVEATVGAGARVEHPFAVRAEQTSGAISSLLFAEPDAQRVVRLNLATGQRTTISGSGVGSGPALGRIIDFVPDTRAPANGGALFGLLSSPGNALVSIDIATGNRTSLTALAAATQPRNLKLDATGNRVLYTNVDFNGSTGGLYAIQLPGFAQSAVSSSIVGSGTAFTGPGNFVLEPEINPTRALLVDINPSRWLQVDLASGARAIFTSSSGNPSLPLIGPLHFDGVNSQVYGLNLYPPHLFVTSVTPGGGAFGRGLISGQVSSSMGIIGGGPLVDFGAGLFVDTTRNVAYVSESTAGAIMAIDLASGDRVVIGR